MKKKMVLLLSFLSVFMLVACKNSSELVKTDYFEIDEATKKGKEYMQEISKEGENSIGSYSLQRVAENSNNVILNYKVSKLRGIDVDVDEFDIKVIDGEEGYKVKDVNAKNLIQVYLDGENLRIKQEDTGSSDLLIRKKDLPSDVYPKKDYIILNKISIEVGDYDKLAIDLKGKRVGIVNKSNKGYLISLAEVENASQTIGSNDSTGGTDNNGSSVDPSTLEEIMEKPIASNLVPYDLIEAKSIEKVSFSADGSFFIVQINNGNSSSLKIYKNPSGELLDMDLDKIFSPEKYTLNINTINDEGLFVKVSAIGNDKEEEGLYKLDLKAMKILNVD